MQRASFLPLSTAVLVLAAGTGCTGDQMLATAYNVGQQHACKQNAEHRPNESMEDLKCITASQSEGGRSWEEYRDARARELGAD